MKYAEGVEGLVSKYDAFIVDQWGVIHDGNKCYEGASEALKVMMQAKKTVIILTNSSKPNFVNRDRLRLKFGIEATQYSELISSTEILEKILNSGQYGIIKKMFVVADEMDKDYAKDFFKVEPVSLADASAVLLMSITPGQGLLEHRSWLDEANRKGLRIFCPSSDPRSVSVGGVVDGLQILTRYYQESKGEVVNAGKPERWVYDECYLLMPGLDRKRILAIGDQWGSDIVGAKRQGIDAALVLTGAAENMVPTTTPKESIVDYICSKSGERECYPDWVLPSFRN